MRSKTFVAQSGANFCGVSASKFKKPEKQKPVSFYLFI